MGGLTINSQIPLDKADLDQMEDIYFKELGFLIHRTNYTQTVLLLADASGLNGGYENQILDPVSKDWGKMSVSDCFDFVIICPVFCLR